MSTITEITSPDQWERHLASLPASTLLIASFHAPWAAPCAQMAVVLRTLAAEYPGDDGSATSWVSLNAEDLSDVSEAYDVTAVPFLVLLREGQVVDTVSGSSAVKVRAAIEKHAAGRGPAAAVVPAATNGGGGGGGGEHDARAPTLEQQTAAVTPKAGGNRQAGEQQPAEQQVETDPARQKEELFRRLGELVRAAPVMLFMKGTPSEPQCGFSRRMVGILRERSVRYGFFNILADDEVRQGLKEFADWPTFPQLWVDGELVGGLDIVKEEIEGNADFFQAYSVSKANGEAEADAAS